MGSPWPTPQGYRPGYGWVSMSFVFALVVAFGLLAVL